MSFGKVGRAALALFLCLLVWSSARMLATADCVTTTESSELRTRLDEHIQQSYSYLDADHMQAKSTVSKTSTENPSKNKDSAESSNKSRASGKARTGTGNTKTNKWDIGVAQVNSYLNVRSTPSMSGAVVGRMYDDGTCRVLSREGDWVKVRFDSGEGYVHSDYLLTGKQARSYLESMTAQSLTVSASALYVRREASADSEILTVLSRGTAVSPVHEKKARTAVADKVKKTGASASGNWIEVALGNRQKGYVCADYIGFSKAPAMDSQAVVSALNESAAARPAVTASVPAPAPSPVSAAPALTAPAVTEAEAVDIPVNTSLYDTPIADMTQEDTAAAEGAADPEPASPDERVLLASIIQAEAGNQSEEGMLAVGSVVMNRVNDDRFPDTISEVIYQPNQFTPASTGVLANILQTGPSEECLETADSLLEEGERNVSNLYFKSASYAHSHGINGRQIGDQVFH